MTDYTLHWNLHPGFRAYVSEIPDGRTEWLGGRGRADLDDIVFDGHRSDFDATRVRGWLEFSGGVRFTGYRNMLHVEIREPRIEFEANGARLLVRTSAEGNRILIAEIRKFATYPRDMGFRVSGETTLTESGTVLLGGVYQPGEPAAPLTVEASGDGSLSF